MNARGMIALAMSLGLGIACQTTRGERTATAPTTAEAEREQREQQAREQQEQQDTMAQQEVREARPGELVFTGEVSDVYGDTLFVMNELGRTELLEVGPETQITVKGRAAQLSDIQEGQEVRAAYETRGSRNVAIRIAADEPGTMPQREPGTTEQGEPGAMEQGEPGTMKEPTAPGR